MGQDWEEGVSFWLMQVFQHLIMPSTKMQACLGVFIAECDACALPWLSHSHAKSPNSRRTRTSAGVDTDARGGFPSGKQSDRVTEQHWARVPPLCYVWWVCAVWSSRITHHFPLCNYVTRSKNLEVLSSASPVPSSVWDFTQFMWVLIYSYSPNLIWVLFQLYFKGAYKLLGRRLVCSYQEFKEGEVGARGRSREDLWRWSLRRQSLALRRRGPARMADECEEAETREQDNLRTWDKSTNMSQLNNWSSHWFLHGSKGFMWHLVPVWNRKRKLLNSMCVIACITNSCGFSSHQVKSLWLQKDLPALHLPESAIGLVST